MKHSSFRHKYFKSILIVLFFVFIVGLFFVLHQTNAGVVDQLRAPGISADYTGSIIDIIRIGIGNIIRGILIFIGSIMLAIIIYGGITILTSAGNTDRLGKGKTTITWAVIGLIIVLTSSATVSFIVQQEPPAGGDDLAHSDPNAPPPPGSATQCNDTVDNETPGDTLIDEDDPECHIDGDLTNAYVASHNDESTPARAPGTNECIAVHGAGYYCLEAAKIEDPAAYTPSTASDPATADCHPDKTPCSIGGVSNSGYCCKTSYSGITTSGTSISCNACSDKPAAGSSPPYAIDLVSKCISVTAPATLDKSKLELPGADASRITLETGTSGNTGRIRYSPTTPPSLNPESINYKACLTDPPTECCSGTLTVFPITSSVVPPTCKSPTFLIGLTKTGAFENYSGNPIKVFDDIVIDNNATTGTFSITGTTCPTSPRNIKLEALSLTEYRYSAYNDATSSLPTRCDVSYKYQGAASAGDCTGKIILDMTVPITPPPTCSEITYPLFSKCPEYINPTSGLRECRPVPYYPKNQAGAQATCKQKEYTTARSCCDCGMTGTPHQGWVCLGFSTESFRDAYYDANKSDCEYLHCGDDAGIPDICCKKP